MQQTVISDINTVNTLITSNKSNLLIPSKYQSNYSEIVDNETEIINLRSNLDMKMREIYGLNDTVIGDSIIMNDSALYSGILFTILATTILYYTFTKL
jgi:translation initiation factor 6 (eIF-6)